MGDDMTELDLVAQAMAPTNQPRKDQPAPPRNIQPTGPDTAKNGLQTSNPPAQPAFTAPGAAAPKSATPDRAQGGDGNLPPSDAFDFDLSTLSQADRELMAPLLAAMNLASGAHGDANGAEDDERIGELLAQMDAAGEVADELESKLDRLIAQLGAEEKGLQDINPGQGGAAHGKLDKQ